ncbi:MAG: hypothetical protein FIA96_12320 [Betaproteobacteria bacterium]|nr:hypothetical protein [Betaproteobacteria bacterium]
MSPELSVTLAGFVAWCREHISGDEEGEVQLFLDHLFRAFGHAGLKEAGATREGRPAATTARPQSHRRRKSRRWRYGDRARFAAPVSRPGAPRHARLPRH